jgi:putative transposase
MTSYRQLLYHIIIRTKDSRKSISQDCANKLYGYITGIIKNKNCHLYRINGIEDHIHILTDLHSSVALADFVRDIKVSTSVWMKECGYFPTFEGWSEGYGSFTCSYLDMGDLTEYIKGQQEHHKSKSFYEEYRKLIIESGLTVDDKYFP